MPNFTLSIRQMQICVNCNKMTIITEYDGGHIYINSYFYAYFDINIYIIAMLILYNYINMNVHIDINVNTYVYHVLTLQI